MALSIEPKIYKPPRILIYGPQGLGKSTFGSLADNPIFIRTEDGLDALDVPTFPKATSFQQLMGYLQELATDDHDRKTLVVDSIDWLEPLIWKEVAESQGKKSIEDIGYGKGYVMALDLWREYLDALDYLRDEKGMMIIQIAHAQIKRFENPETEAYDRYEIKLHKNASPLLLEHCEIVLFVNHYVSVTKEKKGTEKDGRKRAVGGKERILYTTERPSAIAKSRYDLPEEIPFDHEGRYWGIIAGAVPYFAKKNVKTNQDDNAESKQS